MSFPHRGARWMSVIALLVGALWVSPATAAPFTATWNVVPSTYPAAPPPSPFYDCTDWGAGGLFCDWLWDQGLEVSKVSSVPFPMYGDSGPFYDAFGLIPPLESEIGTGIGGDGYLTINTSCRAGLDPCFLAFTPRSMVVDLYSDRGPAGVFLTSSRGGLIKAPNGTATVTFAGPEWTDITGIGVGIYLPDVCGDPDNARDCRLGELGLSIYRLEFDATPLPEPASGLLVGTALLAALRRHRRS